MCSRCSPRAAFVVCDTSKSNSPHTAPRHPRSHVQRFVAASHSPLSEQSSGDVHGVWGGGGDPCVMERRRASICDTAAVVRIVAVG